MLSLRVVPAFCGGLSAPPASRTEVEADEKLDEALGTAGPAVLKEYIDSVGGAAEVRSAAFRFASKGNVEFVWSVSGCLH